MIFYNGFNLMVDLILAFIVFKIAYSFGHSDGSRETEERLKPPF
jgi:hypothetical protein